MNDLLLQLRDKGNTVLVVDTSRRRSRSRTTSSISARRAGSEGGEVVFEGTVEGLRAKRHADGDGTSTTELR